MSITPYPPPPLQVQSQPDDFEMDPEPSTSKKPIYPRTSPPARSETPPTPELTFASAFNPNHSNVTLLEAANAPDVLSPTPLSLLLCPSPTHSTAESYHGSPIVSPYAISSSSASPSSSRSSGFESISLRSLSSETLARRGEEEEFNDDDDAIQRPPAPAFLRENSAVYTQGRMIWRPTTYVPSPRGGGGGVLPFAIIEEEEPPEEPVDDDDDHESYYSAESGSGSVVSSGSEEQGKTQTEVRSNGGERSDIDRNLKGRKRGSLGKRIKRMFVEKREAVMGLKV